MFESNQPSVVVLLPCFNEEVTIGKVVRDFKAALPDATVYVYDNNSTDRTAEIAAAEGAIVRREPRQGKGNVIRAMFEDIDADVYVMADGDDTYPADAAPAMVSKVLDGYDMVIGDRLSSTYFQENKRPFHNFGNRLVRASINGLFHAQVTDIMTGYRAFSFTFAKTYPVLSRGFEVETEMTIHSLNNNLRLYEMPVQYRDRPAGSVSKLDTVGDGIRVMGTIFRMIREYKPLPFFGTIGLLIGVIGILLCGGGHLRVRQDRARGPLPHAHRRHHARHRRSAAVRHRHHPRRHRQERPQDLHHRHQPVRIPQATLH